jgi:hypothetical protein
MRSDLSEHYCCVQKGMESQIQVIWTHKLFSNCPNLQIILRYLLCTVAAINLETPRFFYCKLFVNLTMLLTYQFRLRQSVECAQR